MTAHNFDALDFFGTFLLAPIPHGDRSLLQAHADNFAYNADFIKSSVAVAKLGKLGSADQWINAMQENRFAGTHVQRYVLAHLAMVAIDPETDAVQHDVIARLFSTASQSPDCQLREAQHDACQLASLITMNDDAAGKRLGAFFHAIYKANQEVVSPAGDPERAMPRKACTAGFIAPLGGPY